MEQNLTKIAGIEVDGKLYEMLLNDLFEHHKITLPLGYIKESLLELESEGLIKKLKDEDKVGDLVLVNQVEIMTSAIYDGAEVKPLYKKRGKALKGLIIVLTKKGQMAILEDLLKKSSTELSQKRKLQALADIILYGYGAFQFNHEEWNKFLQLDSISKKQSWLMTLSALEEEGCLMRYWQKETLCDYFIDFLKWDHHQLSFKIPKGKNQEIFQDYAKAFNFDLNKLGEPERNFLDKGKLDFNDNWIIKLKRGDYPSAIRLMKFLKIDRSYYNDRPGIGDYVLDRDIFKISSIVVKRLIDRKKPFPTKTELDNYVESWYRQHRPDLFVPYHFD